MRLLLSVGCRTEQQRLFPVEDQFSAENKTRTTIVSTLGPVIFRERSDAQFPMTQSRLDMIFSENKRRGIATVSTVTSSWPVCFHLFMASQSVFMASQSDSTSSWPVSLFPPLPGHAVSRLLRLQHENGH